MRVDLYGTIHKAQRFHLFQLANEIATANLKNAEEVQKISTDMQSLIEQLKDHAKNEEVYIHPLFEKVGANTLEQIEGDHHSLEAQIENLEKCIHGKQLDALYSQYTGFLGVYLTHLTAEETAQREILWNHYDDQALMSVFERFKAERTPQQAKADLEFMLPALSIAERSLIFSGLKE